VRYVINLFDSSVKRIQPSAVSDAGPTLVVGALVLLAIGGVVAMVGWSLERHSRAPRGDRTATT
jgi:hypothetical protein